MKTCEVWPDIKFIQKFTTWKYKGLCHSYGFQVNWDTDMPRYKPQLKFTIKNVVYCIGWKWAKVKEDG
jgi:hypothetical protein